MRPLIWALVLIGAVIVQSTWLPLIAIGGVRPDIMLIIVVSSGVLLGRHHGVGLGFFAGLLQDLASGNVFGLNVLAKMAVGYLAGQMERKVFKENILLPVMAVILATVISSAIAVFVLLAGGYKPDILAETANMLYAIGYNAVLSIPVHRLTFHIAQSEMPDPTS